jgi:coenzyme F420-reducing hydrogenase delta subunit
MGHALPVGVQFVEVPCGGTVAGGHILAGFEAGAAGVMLCTCHTGNCQSETGNQVARKRADSVRHLLTAAGLEQDRVRITSVAANMGNEFAFVINEFVNQIRVFNGA